MPNFNLQWSTDFIGAYGTAYDTFVYPKQTFNRHWFISTRNLLKNAYNAYSFDFDPYNDPSVFASDTNTNSCSFTVNSFTQSLQGAFFGGGYHYANNVNIAASYPDSIQETALYNANDAQEGGVVWLTYASFTLYQDPHSDPNQSFDDQQFWNSIFVWRYSTPRVYHPEFSTFNYRGHTVLHRTYDNVAKKLVHSGGIKYDGDNITLTARINDATNNGEHMLAPRGSFSGGNSSVLSVPGTTQPVVADFLFDWGNGDEVQIVPAGPLQSRGGVVVGNTMQYPVTRSRHKMRKPRVRARDNYGRSGPWMPLTLFPQADASASIEPNWDASKSFGRDARLVHYSWLFDYYKQVSQDGNTIINPILGEQVSYDFTADIETTGEDTRAVILLVTDENGRSDYSEFYLHVERHMDAWDDETGSLYTAVSEHTPGFGINGFVNNVTPCNALYSDVKIYRFYNGIGGREELQTIPNHRNPCIWKQNGRWFVLAEKHNSPSNYSLFYSDDGLNSIKNLNSPITTMWNGYRHPRVWPVIGGGAVSIALSNKIYFRRSPDGLSWPTSQSSTIEVGGFQGVTGDRRICTIRQLSRNGRTTLIVTNGYELNYRSTDMGRTWEPFTPATD